MRKVRSKRVREHVFSIHVSIAPTDIKPKDTVPTFDFGYNHGYKELDSSQNQDVRNEPFKHNSSLVFQSWSYK